MKNTKYGRRTHRSCMVSLILGSSSSEIIFCYRVYRCHESCVKYGICKHGNFLPSSTCFSHSCMGYEGDNPVLQIWSSHMLWSGPVLQCSGSR